MEVQIISQFGRDFLRAHDRQVPSLFGPCWYSSHWHGGYTMRSVAVRDAFAQFGINKSVGL